MAKSVFRTVLVIGDDPDSIIKKYSADTKVDMHVVCHLDDSPKLRKQHLKYMEGILTTDKIKLTDSQRENYKDMYLDIKDMTDFEYYRYITSGCLYDEENGDALSDVNPDAYYKSEKCYDKRLKKYGEESAFSNPFKLKDGSLAYSARMGEIDWTLNHMCNTKVYEAAWELVMDGREPVDDMERNIKERMSNRVAYFMNFADKEEYVRHSCSFWTYGVAFADRYEEVDYHVRDKDWVAGFYDRYINGLPDDTLLTIYEVRSLSDY